MHPSAPIMLQDQLEADSKVGSESWQLSGTAVRRIIGDLGKE